MSRLAADAARVATGHSVSDRTGCPLCGRTVVYRGLTDVECESLQGACPNGGRHPKPAPEASGEYDFYEAELRESHGASHQERWNVSCNAWYHAPVSRCHAVYSPRWRMAPGWTWVTFGAVTSGGRRGGYEVYNAP